MFELKHHDSGGFSVLLLICYSFDQLPVGSDVPLHPGQDGRGLPLLLRDGLLQELSGRGYSTPQDSLVSSCHSRYDRTAVLSTAYRGIFVFDCVSDRAVDPFSSQYGSGSSCFFNADPGPALKEL